MQTRSAQAAATAVLLAVILASSALAGQVRIHVSNAASAMQFFPSTQSLNLGDQVVWVWIKGPHSVRSGSSCATGDGRFDSGEFITNGTTGTAFTWKSSVSGSVPYVCTPHCAMGMVGTLTVNASGTAVADFRITEVQYNVAGGLDLIEITNLGGAPGDLGRYRFAAGGDTATVPTNSWVVPVGTRVVVHANSAGAQSAPSTLFLPTLADLPVSGSLALYTPNTINTNLADATQIVDFVQWGAAAQPNEATAASASLWNPGEFIPTMSDGHSIEFCGTASDHGLASWAEISLPNFGSNGNCTTPALHTTWGRIKTLYR
jgi:plastocyanin